MLLHQNPSHQREKTLMNSAFETLLARRSDVRRRSASRTPPVLLLCLLLLGAPKLRAAALLEQSFTLAAGWNLIHVAVEPVDKNPLTAFSAIDWESLWTWLPTETEPRGGRWLAIYRDAPSFLGTLFSFSGPNPYLLLTRSGGTLRVKGSVRTDRQALRGNAYQLFGPSFDSASAPSFSTYFSRPDVKDHIGSGFELSGQTYRRLSAADTLRPGAAYWVFPDQGIPTPDPLRLGVGLSGLRFDSQTTVQEIVVDVGAQGGGGGGGGVAPRQFAVRALPSAGGDGNTDWIELQKPDGTFAAIGAGAAIETTAEQSQVRVTFRAQREGLATAGGGNQAAVVELVSPEGKIAVGAELEVPGLKGTWLGEATITEVERPSFHGGGYAPAPAVSVSLILEIPSAGPARLLPCVSVDSSRDGRNVSYRLSAVLFTEAVDLAGTVTADGSSGTLRGAIAMGADHPLNPYRHRYHPELGLGYEVTRSLKLRFGADGAAPAPENPLAAVGALTGVYEEEINGLSSETIRIRGAFRLRRLAGGSATPCVPAGQ